MLLVVLQVHGRNEDRGMSEQIVHFFERPLCGFGLNSPEKQRVCEVADNLGDPVSLSSACKGFVTYEDIVVPVPDFF